ncbi:MAG TPA: hypothetical protein VMD76_09750 [Candidatus Sulfotelmatobacter sp.]|nr:hypothetical protein [Candidatus Sulfotelmatobacter sp.]
MDDRSSPSDLDFRVALLERAVTENARRLAELARVLRGDKRSGARETVTIDADSVSPFAAGFHFRETDATGRPYRWTGRGDFFELRVRLDRNTDWTFEMDLRGNDHVNVASLRGFVDYVEVPIAFSVLEAHAIGEIPAKPLSDVAVLTFYLPAHFVPSKLDPTSVDHRTLSAVFYGLKLVPGDGSAAKQ